MIVNDADKMGLSQLYQLRGRVGRSNKVAYAYFLYQRDKVLTEVAEKRLKALKDFTELGSGFKIAMRDLEIRGAGNMMGSAQHGHMAAIGYDLYCRMLEDTIKIVKGEIEREPVETTVDLKVDAFIPSSYIKDEIQKIEVYKKIAAIENEEDYECVREELNIEEIKEKNEDIIFIFESRERTDKRIFKVLLEEYKDDILIEFGDKPTILYRVKDKKKEDVLSTFKEMLDKLIALNN